MVKKHYLSDFSIKTHYTGTSNRQAITFEVSIPSTIRLEVGLRSLSENLYKKL